MARSLFIHLAALAALAGQRPETAAGLLDATLRREARYWRQSVDDLGLPDPARRGMEQAMALLTLTDGARTAARARGLIAQVPTLRGADRAVRDDIQTLAQTFYPLDGGIDALRPDILGERLVARELARDDELLDLALGDGADARTAALSVLTRLAQHNEGGDLWLRRGLERHLGACAETALAVAVKVGDPCGPVLGEVLDASPAAVRLALCDRLHPQLPEQTVALLELAEVISRQRLTAVRSIPGRVPKNPKQRARLSERVHDYAMRQYRLGRLDEAHDLWQEALTIASTLERPGDLPSQANVAGALTNLGSVLSGLGDYNQAFVHDEKALRIFQRLDNIQRNRFSRDLALSLNNYGERLADLGQFGAALDHAKAALKIRRRLAVARSEGPAASLARSLNSVGNYLAAHGQFAKALEHAEQALAVCRDLVIARPDGYAPEVAGMLNSASNRLSDLGRFSESYAYSDEALQIHRRLAEARPDAFEEDVAMSLCNMGVRLSELGSSDRALPHVEEGTQLLRRLAASRPDRFGASLARNLGNQALVLMLRGQPGPAERSAAKALELMAQQPGARSAALQGESAWALAIHAWSQVGLGHLARAAEQAGRACETIDLTLANRPRALPQPAALAYWIGWRCAEALGDRATGQHRADQALGVLNLWVENGALALPAYLVPAATELLDADDRPPGAADRYLALKALLHRSAVG